MKRDIRAAAQANQVWRIQDTVPGEWDRLLIVPPYSDQATVRDAAPFDVGGLADDMQLEDGGTLLVFGLKDQVWASAFVPNDVGNLADNDLRSVERIDCVFVVKRDGDLSDGSPHYRVELVAPVKAAPK